MKVLGLGWLQDVWSRREKTRFSCAQQVKRGCKQNSSPPAWWNFLRLSSRSGWLMCVCATGLPNFQISLYMMRSENASPLCSMQMIWPHRNTLQFYHMAFMCPKRLIIISLVNTTNSAQLLQAIFFFFFTFFIHCDYFCWAAIFYPQHRVNTTMYHPVKGQLVALPVFAPFPLKRCLHTTDFK